MSRRRAFFFAPPALPAADVAPQGSVLDQDSPYLRLGNAPGISVVNRTTTPFSGNGNWGRESNPAYQDNTGAYLFPNFLDGYRLKWVGTGIQLAGVVFPSGGDMAITVDGVAYTGSCYAPSGGMAPHFTLSGLALGIHEIIVLKAANAASTTLFLDAVNLY